MKIIIFFLLIIISSFSYGQTRSRTSNLVSHSTISRINFSHGPDPFGINTKNYLCFNTMLIFRGILSFGYERVLTDKSTLMANFGLTHRDFIYEIWGNNQLDLLDRTTKSSIGYFLDLSYKFYPNDFDDFNALYFSPGIAYKKYNLKAIDQYGKGSSISQELNVGYTMTEGYIKIGYMYEAFLFDDVTVDAYFGFGYRSINQNTYEEIPSADLNNSRQYTLQPKTITINVPAIYLGTRIGIGF